MTDAQALPPGTIPPAPEAPPQAARSREPMPELTHRRRMQIFGFLLLCTFMAMLDNQIVSTALPTIVGEFGALERFGWVGSAYLLAQASVMPVYGKLGDLIGRKYVLMVAVGLFVLGSLACSLAWSMDSLIGFRVLQGLGAGGIMVSIFAVNADIFAPRERAKRQSMSSLVLMAAASIGPTLGGVMSETLGWRSIFFVNVPVGAIALIGLYVMLPLTRSERRPKLDVAGALTLAATIAGVVLLADSAQIFGALISWQSGVLLCTILVMGAIWVAVERRAAEPVVPLYLFKRRNFSLLLVVALTSGSVAIGLANYHAFYLQLTTGLSPSRAGLFFIAITGGLAVGSLTAGRLIARTAIYKPWLAAGLAISTVSLSSLSFLPVGTGFAVLAAIFMLHGFSVGLAQQSPVIGIQIEAPGRDVGAATGAVTLGRIAGASLAMSVYGAILSGMLAKVQIPGLGTLADAAPSAVNALPEAAREAARQAVGHAYHALYLSAAVIAVIGLVAALALRPVRLEGPLRTESARKSEPGGSEVASAGEAA
ncbi:MAG: MDR family MFS transporter [Paenirhodobacter sp.]|uniref:MDR family MFS transporter n=1 Tax=Paenirhodobacter sp. TaxID=1965326 RepID=UPI003D0CE7AB